MLEQSARAAADSMRKCLLILAGLCSSVSSAQNSEYERMLEALEVSSHGRVLIFAPTIFDIHLANSIRQTYLDRVRNTKVKLVTIQYYNYLAKSTILSLAVINVPIYEVQTPAADGIIIIDNQGWKGRNLGKVPNPNMERLSVQEINNMLLWFNKATGKNTRITQYEALDRLKQVLK
ncbi:hypothetical protein [Deinococcus sp. AJ005]|uniref:hypothetical protein n=1 Tax=Deinococcus sp. AJ005 TaxID=2652443 RepID=UPI00125CD108|nr:hypothetical protein [Deinococcus sp. AJ005]QFP78593.1 hypothetical protein DAAJ005_18655 [Deinococcus sp. AJ005]